ncbi:hypothetical protein SAY87_021710 [Trapa incisa]|uniref:Uncharacterized protein n=1 Tax=Trapa incisa TaxID=236973 RepID=A0AAN7PQX2_9MYRT|nr:hypothetical protein SAY87_021710 [Trapa incisa]
MKQSGMPRTLCLSVPAQSQAAPAFLILSFISETKNDVLYRGYAEQPPVHFQYHFLDANGDISFKIADAVPGLRTVLRVVVPYTGKAEMQYTHDYVGVTAGVGLTANSSRGYSPVLGFSGAVGCTLFSVGTDIAFDISARAFSRLNAGLGFNTPYLAASLNINDKLDCLRANICCTLTPLASTAIAAEVTHRFSSNETSVTMGTQHAILPLTLVKSRVSTKGKVGALIEQGLWQKLYVTVSGEADFGSLKWLPKLGVSVKLRP